MGPRDPRLGRAGGLTVTPRCAVLCLALAGAAPALAQESAGADDERWRVAVGGGVISAPKFPGSDRQRTLVLPFVAASWGRFFVGGDPAAGSAGAIGLRLYTDSHWRLAAGLSADLGHRKESDDPRLTGLGDVRRTASAVVAAAYTYEWLTARVRVASDILGHDQGTLVRFDLIGRTRAGERTTLFAGPGVTWADRRYAQTFFGVSADQSARSVLPQFDAGAGWNSARFTMGANYRIAARWNLGAFASYARLQGDAVDSPITEDRSQYFAGVFLTYRFGNTPGLREPATSL
jgi:outer membrane scaffolding protein for murein synthesis (MipA/OmpV family)